MSHIPGRLRRGAVKVLQRIKLSRPQASPAMIVVGVLALIGAALAGPNLVSAAPVRHPATYAPGTAPDPGSAGATCKGGPNESFSGGGEGDNAITFRASPSSNDGTATGSFSGSSGTAAVSWEALGVDVTKGGFIHWHTEWGGDNPGRSPSAGERAFDARPCVKKLPPPDDPTTTTSTEPPVTEAPTTAPPVTQPPVINLDLGKSVTCAQTPPPSHYVATYTAAASDGAAVVVISNISAPGGQLADNTNQPGLAAFHVVYPGDTNATVKVTFAVTINGGATLSKSLSLVLDGKCYVPPATTTPTTAPPTTAPPATAPPTTAPPATVAPTVPPTQPTAPPTVAPTVPPTAASTTAAPVTTVAPATTTPAPVTTARPPATTTPTTVRPVVTTPPVTAAPVTTVAATVAPTTAAPATTVADTTPTAATAAPDTTSTLPAVTAVKSGPDDYQNGLAILGIIMVILAIIVAAFGHLFQPTWWTYRLPQRG